LQDGGRQRRKRGRALSDKNDKMYLFALIVKLEVVAFHKSSGRYAPQLVLAYGAIFSI
jgi:hypothetical protein